MTKASALLDIMNSSCALKKVLRTGWVWRGISEAESVADHSYGTALLSMLLVDALIREGVVLQSEKIIRMAILHDLAEARVGDIPAPALKYIPVHVKKEAEKKAMQDILTSLDQESSSSYLQLWNEYEQAETFEAKIVKAADKIEMLIQAFDYEKTGKSNLDEFWQFAQQTTVFDFHPLIKDIQNELLLRHSKL